MVDAVPPGVRAGLEAWLDPGRQTPSPWHIGPRSRQALARWLLSGDAGPDDWHRLALAAERWDDPAAARWIAHQPECDRATALRIFWGPGPSDDPPSEPLGDGRWSLALGPTRAGIRDRWLAGAYRRAELAYTVGTDPDALHLLSRSTFPTQVRQFGAEAVDAAYPASMRGPILEGRRLGDEGFEAGLPVRLWDAAELAEHREPRRIVREPPPWPVDAEPALREWADDPDDDDAGSVERDFARWLLSGAASPDERHRYAANFNWDQGTDAARWIVQRPDCDQATALTVFWLSRPSYHHRFRFDRATVWAEATEPEAFDLALDIAERWRAGFYRRAEIAFVFGTDPSEDHFCSDDDFEALEREYGRAEVERWMPSSMRRSLPGRTLDDDGLIEGIPARFWPEDLR